MPLLRTLETLGDRFRRDENDPDPSLPRTSTATTACPPPSPAHTFHIPRFPAPAPDVPDLFYADRDLGDAVHNLHDVRTVLADLARAADAHREMLSATAASQRVLGEALITCLDHGGRDADAAFGDDGGRMGVVASFLSDDNCASQRSLGESFINHGTSMVKLGQAFCAPIAELLASFEERVDRKILPLRKRYAHQKGQYLKYVRASDAAEDGERRNYFDALAQAAKPVWVRTSKQLRTEATVMTQLTSRNIAKWSRVMALQHERSLSIAATNYAEAFGKAKALNR